MIVTLISIKNDFKSRMFTHRVPHPLENLRVGMHPGNHVYHTVLENSASSNPNPNLINQRGEAIGPTSCVR